MASCSQNGSVIQKPMRLISRGKLVRYVAGQAGRKDQAAVGSALDAWYLEVKRAAWRNSAEVKARYATASVVSASRVVFNIKGNDHRLIVEIDYAKRIVWTIWIGTHAQYDRIEARTVRHAP
jgi:mRNA interferase HigB